MRRTWTEADIECELRAVVAQLGRMPSTRDLVAAGMNALSVQVTRTCGGFPGWAKRLGATQRESDSLRGRLGEDHVQVFLAARGYQVERQSARAPFDLLVNGRVRIDVKSAVYGEWSHRDGSLVRGFLFAGARGAPGKCDLFVLCGMSPDGTVLWRYFVPAAVTPKTITITPTGQKYARYREALDELERLLKEAV